MRINRIIIHGFKDPLKKVDISFSKEPVTVIYGKNGSGKTTLLKILFAAISRDESTLIEQKVHSVTIYYHVDGIDDELTATVRQENTMDIKYNWDEFLYEENIEISSLMFGVNRGITNVANKIFPDLIVNFIRKGRYFSNFDGGLIIERFAEELVDFINYYNKPVKYRRSINGRKQVGFDEKHLSLDNINIEQIEELLLERYRIAKYISSQRVQKALFDTLSLAINPESDGKKNSNIMPDDFPEILEKNKDQLIEALGNTTENTLRDQIIRILKSYKKENILNSFQASTPLLRDLLYKMIIELDTEQATLNSINILVEIFNDQIDSNKKLKITQEKAFIELGDKTHPLSELSSGERHLLSFLTLFIVEGHNRTFLLIDEPEISLNIKWQRNLLPLLNNLAPKAQIIVASHSPSIAKHNSNYLVELKPLATVNINRKEGL